jgi:hypothetical protein
MRSLGALLQHPRRLTYQELTDCLKGKFTFGGFHFEGNTLN